MQPLSTARRSSIGALTNKAPSTARPTQPSSRRLSCPPAGPAAAAAADTRRHWVTTQATTWRTAPSDVGFKIDHLPVGWRVTEVPSQDDLGDWMAIEPRGFVKRTDLRPCQAPQPLRTSASTASPGPTSLVSEADRAAYLAEREAHLRLREENVALREQELEKRKELEALQRSREALAREVLQLQERKAAEAEQLTSYQRQGEVMKEKLERCREAIYLAVQSVDELYEQRSAFVNGGHSLSATPLANAKTAATVAGKVAQDLLASFCADEEENRVPAEHVMRPFGAKKVIDAAVHTDSVPRVPLRQLNVVNGQ